MLWIIEHLLSNTAIIWQLFGIFLAIIWQFIGQLWLAHTARRELQRQLCVS